MENPAKDTGAPLEWPVDAEVERQRLVDDATARGVDPDEWLRLASELAALHHPSPEDYRAVDRHLVSGHSVDETRAELVDHESSQPPPSVPPNLTHDPGEGERYFI